MYSCIYLEFEAYLVLNRPQHYIRCPRTDYRGKEYRFAGPPVSQCSGMTHFYQVARRESYPWRVRSLGSILFKLTGSQMYVLLNLHNLWVFELILSRLWVILKK